MVTATYDFYGYSPATPPPSPTMSRSTHRMRTGGHRSVQFTDTAPIWVCDCHDHYGNSIKPRTLFLNR